MTRPEHDASRTAPGRRGASPWRSGRRAPRPCRTTAVTEQQRRSVATSVATTSSVRAPCGDQQEDPRDDHATSRDDRPRPRNRAARAGRVCWRGKWVITDEPRPEQRELGDQHHRRHDRRRRRRPRRARTGARPAPRTRTRGPSSPTLAAIRVSELQTSDSGARRPRAHPTARAERARRASARRHGAFPVRAPSGLQRTAPAQHRGHADVVVGEKQTKYGIQRGCRRARLSPMPAQRSGERQPEEQAARAPVRATIRPRPWPSASHWPRAKAKSSLEAVLDGRLRETPIAAPARRSRQRRSMSSPDVKRSSKSCSQERVAIEDRRHDAEPVLAAPGAVMDRPAPGPSSPGPRDAVQAGLQRGVAARSELVAAAGRGRPRADTTSASTSATSGVLGRPAPIRRAAGRPRPLVGAPHARRSARAISTVPSVESPSTTMTSRAGASERPSAGSRRSAARRCGRGRRRSGRSAR